MTDVDLQVRLNKRIRLTFTVGEDRTAEVLVTDGNTLMPIDLTGATLTLALPRCSGYAIKRRTGALQFAWSQVVNLGGVAVFSVPSHGLASGDKISLAPGDADSPLLAPFASGPTYLAIASSANTFALVQVDSEGNSAPVALVAPGKGQVSLTSGDFQITQPSLGLASCRLTAACTSSCAVGQGQAYQLIYTDADNLTRIFSGAGMLDVLGQADYLQMGSSGSADA